MTPSEVPLATGDSGPLPQGRLLAVIVGVLVLTSTIPGLAVVAGAAESSAAGDTPSALDGGATDPFPQQETPTDNESTQHEDPDEARGSGDRAGLQRWLSDRLTAGLEGNLVQLSEGEYELAEGFIGEEWEERLGQYVDVAGETDSEDDDEVARELEETAEEQRNYTRAVREYRETLEQLRAAQAAGNQTAVRLYAHRLEELARRIEGTNETLAQRYTRISNATGQDLGREIELLQNITTNITTTQQDIVEQTFVRTRLTVSANRTRIAFTRPMRLEGRLVTANGSAIGERAITVRVGPRSHTLLTDSDGRFTVSYRPVALPLDRETLTVGYQPGATAPYLGNQTTVPVSIEQVEADLSLEAAGGPYRFDDAVSGDVAVRVDGQPVPRVQTTLAVGGQRLAAGQTASDGTVRLAGPLPATVPTGSDSVRASIPWEGRAIGPAAAERAVEIEPTETEVAIQVTAEEGVGLVVNGSLRTAGGTPLGNRSPVFSVADGEDRTLRTTAEGRFGRTIPASALRDRDLNATVAVAAGFDGEGTNLASTRSEQAVTLPGAWVEGSTGMGLLGPLAIGAGLVLVAGLALLAWRDRGEGTAAGETEVDDSPAAVEAPGRQAGPSVLLQRARDLLDRENSAGSVAEAYAAVRQDLSTRYDIPRELTHREFVAACSGVLEEADSRRFGELAEAYERLVFAADVSGERAGEALAAAEALVEG